MTEQALAKREDRMSLEEVKGNVGLIQQVMKEVMHKGEHYGVIPGCGDKPTLLKPGAEKLCTTFRLSPTYDISKTELDRGHREYEIVCTLTHIPTGQVFGQGVGSCSTMESKYRYRDARRKCPECGNESIIKGKAEYGGGWLCWAKKGGCGAKFEEGDPAIEDQDQGKVENPDPADQYNTVLKMAKKRAHVDAVLTVTAASDLFTQDIEDGMNGREDSQPRQAAKPQKDTDTLFEEMVQAKGIGDAMSPYLAEFIRETAETHEKTEEAVKKQALQHKKRFWDGFNTWVKNTASSPGDEAPPVTGADDIPLEDADVPY